MISCFTVRAESGKVIMLRSMASGGAYNSIIPSQGTSTYRVCAASVGFSDLGFFFEEGENKMVERKMATIRRVESIEPIDGADKIALATIGGWKVVVAIDSGFKAGDLAIYCEIDSWIPHCVAPFLSKGRLPRMYDGTEGERLKTVKLRGQLSQGLLLPISLAGEHFLDEGDDVSDLLGIKKWEQHIPAHLSGMCRGSFPSWGRKTDQERIQNLSREFERYKAEDFLFEITEKLEGSSMSVYLHKGEFGVCSRNMNLKETYGIPSTFWDVARRLDMESKMRSIAGADSIMIQGELVGPGIQGNIYNLHEHKFFVFDVFDIARQQYYNSGERRDLISSMTGIEHVPIIEAEAFLPSAIDDVLSIADGESRLASVQREGIVFKSIKFAEISFKAISNKYLLKQK